MVPEPTEGQEIKINRLLWESACPDPDEYIGKIGIVIGPATVNRFLKGLFDVKVEGDVIHLYKEEMDETNGMEV